MAASSLPPVRRPPAGRPAPPPTKAHASPWRRAFRILGWIATACVCAVVFLILRPSDPPRVQSDPGAGRSLERKLQRFATPSAAGEPQSLQLDEPELNAWVHRNVDIRPAADGGAGGGAPPAEAGSSRAPASGEPLPEPLLDSRDTSMNVEEAQSAVRDVKIRLSGDLLTAYVLFDLYGKDISLELEGRLHAVEGYIHLEPTAIWIGSLRLPQPTIDRAMARMFESPEHREHFRLPPGVRDLRIQNGTLVVVRD